MRFNLAIIPTALLVSVICFSATKPNFGGKWALDKNKSFSNPAGLEQTMTIMQNGDQIKMEAHLKTTRGGEQNVNETYMLDGKEADFTPPAPPNAKGKRKASWLPNGQGILIVDEISVDGKPVNQITRKWTLATDGKSLTVDYFIDDQKMSYESKRVFTKVE